MPVCDQNAYDMQRKTTFHSQMDLYVYCLHHLYKEWTDMFSSIPWSTISEYISNVNASSNKTTILGLGYNGFGTISEVWKIRKDIICAVLKVQTSRWRFQSKSQLSRLILLQVHWRNASDSHDPCCRTFLRCFISWKSIHEIVEETIWHKWLPVCLDSSYFLPIDQGSAYISKTKKEFVQAFLALLDEKNI